MIRLRILGTVELRSDDAHELRSVVVQPKRLALLAYLAAAPGSEHRRDTLLAAFWPDLDADHARGALSKALHYLRRSLGDDVIAGHGDSIRVNPERLWCDAAAFEKALDGGRPDEALELYGGDLLKGFYVAGADGFERWLEEERDRLRRRAADAARGLSHSWKATGNLVRAIDHARQALALAGDDEADLRRLVELLVAAGDRAGAVHAYDDFRLRIARDYDIAPSETTEVLMAEVRSAGAAVPLRRATRQAAVAGDPEIPVAAPSGAERATPLAVAPPTTPVGERASPRRIPRAVAAVAALGALLIAAVTPSLVFAPRSTVSVDRQRIVVVPLVNRTGDARFDPLGDMAADWITEGLARTRIASVVPFSAALAASRAVEPAGNLDAPGLARALAREAGAGIVVTGSYYVQADTIILSTQVSDGVTGTVLEGVEPVSAVPDDPSPAFDELRDRVLAALGPHVNPRLHEHAGITGRTPSFVAYRE